MRVRGGYEAPRYLVARMGPPGTRRPRRSRTFLLVAACSAAAFAVGLAIGVWLL